MKRHAASHSITLDMIDLHDPELSLVWADMQAWADAGNEQQEDDPVDPEG